MKSRFIVKTVMLILPLWLCGYLIYNAAWRMRLHFSETPMIIYKDLGVTATEWGTQLVHRVEFDLSNTAITSVVCAVNGETNVLCDRLNNASVLTLGVDEYHKFIESGESWAISLRRGCTNDSYVASVNNCSTNTIIHVRMNEIEFTIPCEESDFVGKLGTNYCKIIVRGML